MTAGTWSAVELGPDKRPSNGTVIATGPTQESVAHLWQPGKVAICWSYDAPPPRRLSAAQLGNVRRKRLRRRLQTKHPLLWKQLYDAELNARPDYYDPKEPRRPTGRHDNPQPIERNDHVIR